MSLNVIIINIIFSKSCLNETYTQINNTFYTTYVLWSYRWRACYFYQQDEMISKKLHQKRHSFLIDTFWKFTYLTFAPPMNMLTLKIWGICTCIIIKSKLVKVIMSRRH